MENLLSQSSKKPNPKEFKEFDSINRTFSAICAESEQINPAILLAEELMRKGLEEVLDPFDLERAEKVLSFSLTEIAAVERQFSALVKTPSEAGLNIPIGF